MPKLTGPLFSVEAHKSLAKALTFQRRPGGAAVYPYKKPKVPLTDRQLWQRNLIRWCVYEWQQLSEDEKAEWEKKAKGQGQSGYSYFIKQRRGYLFDPECVLNLPLYDRRLSGGSFLSMDSYGHSCTVTEAVWTPQGRSFDGTNDVTDCGNNIVLTELALSGNFTIIIWLKWTPSPAKNCMVLSTWEGKADFFTTPYHIYIAGGSDSRLCLYMTFGDSSHWVITQTNVAFPQNEWHHFAAKCTKPYPGWSNGATQCWLDSAGQSTTGWIPKGSVFQTANKILLGLGQTPSTYAFKGLIGEVFLYNLPLTAGEIRHNYLATKWRYQ